MDTLGKVGKTTILVNKGDAQFSKWFTEVHDGPADELLPDVLEAVDKDLS
jgi:NAD-dependent SIR2 family protein deacetylase